MHGLTQLHGVGDGGLHATVPPFSPAGAIVPVEASPRVDGERLRALLALKRNAPLHGNIQEKLENVIVSATDTPGGLFRFHMAWQTSLAFGASEEQAEPLACAIGFFHIASLLFDDLPSMDNSLERRGRICPHLLYGEATTILGALGLITRAYGLLGGAISRVAADRQSRAHALIEQCLGTAGILNGQARDLNFPKDGGTRREVVSVAAGKTAPLFYLALGLPALLFGADPRTLALLRRLSLLWGLFYQGVDDLKDLLESSESSGKTAGRDRELGRPNIALAVGRLEAESYLHRLERRAHRCMETLLIHQPRLAFLSPVHGKLRERWEALFK